ncbi:MAG: hypothetical protein M3463_12235, partial [Verrucomicrobiota bacterium]|nr:hypothetical protein [Verrucomicrobiota bacterium]
HALFEIEQAAEAIRDPELYERAALWGSGRDENPVIMLKVAEQYLAAKRPAQALERLPPEEQMPEHWRSQRHELLVEVHRQAGDKARLREALREAFIREPSDIARQEYLDSLPPSRRAAERAWTREQVRSGDYSPLIKATFFAETGDLEPCAAVILENPEGFDGHFYGPLLRIIDKIEKPHPLAAAVLYRRLLESILARAISKYYHHAARYYRRLEALAPRISDWQGLPPHASYAAALRVSHARKAAFWKRV